MFNDSLTDSLAAERIQGFRRDAHRERLIAMAESSAREVDSVLTRAHRILVRLAHRIRIFHGRTHGLPRPSSARPACHVPHMVDGGAGPMSRDGPFRALRNRNFRVYILGRAISRSGTWVQLIGENRLVLQLGGGGVAVGLTTALYFAPLVVFVPYGGVLVDRSDKRRLLIMTRITTGLLALVLGALALGGLVQIWMIWCTAVLTGCVTSLDNPGGQPLTKQVVGLWMLSTRRRPAQRLPAAPERLGRRSGDLSSRPVALPRASS